MSSFFGRGIGRFILRICLLKDVASFLRQSYELIQEETRQQIQPIENELKAAGFEVVNRIESGVPQTRILEIADAENVSAIVLGSHGRGNVRAG